MKEKRRSRVGWIRKKGMTKKKMWKNMLQGLHVMHTFGLNRTEHIEKRFQLNYILTSLYRVLKCWKGFCLYRVISRASKSTYILMFLSFSIAELSVAPVCLWKMFLGEINETMTNRLPVNTKWEPRKSTCILITRLQHELGVSYFSSRRQNRLSILQFWGWLLLHWL